MEYPIYRIKMNDELHVDIVKFKILDSHVIGAILLFDPFNHYLRGNVITSESMEPIANWLYMEILMHTGCPRKLVFDTAFDCTSINAILSTLNILSGTSWPYSHNGVLAERPIGYIVAAIRTMLSRRKKTRF